MKPTRRTLAEAILTPDTYEHPNPPSTARSGPLSRRPPDCDWEGHATAMEEHGFCPVCDPGEPL